MNKKSRFTWPTELHNEFIASIFDIGLKNLKSEQLLAASAGRSTTSLDSISVFLQDMQRFRKSTSNRIVPEIKRSKREGDESKDVSDKESEKAASMTKKHSVKLSAKTLHPYATGKKFVHKEFPRLKESLIPEGEFMMRVYDQVASLCFQSEQIRRMAQLQLQSIDTTTCIRTSTPFSEISPTDITARPGSSMSSEIDSDAFFSLREDFDASVLKQYL
jgi:hypothetical protein